MVIVVSMTLTQALTFVFVLAERSLRMRGMMVDYLSADVASSVAILERLPAFERGMWIERLQRPNYRVRLGDEDAGSSPLESPSGMAKTVSESLSQVLGQTVVVKESSGADGDLRLDLRLRDGQPVSVLIGPPSLRLSPWLLAALGFELALLVAGCWLAVRQVTQPLKQLADAARSLRPGKRGIALPRVGPCEVLDAAEAFEQMRQRINEHLEERVEMLGSISHDLQTPITRMRLRVDMLREEPLRDKLLADLAQMQHLVEMGLAYARTSQAVEEPLVSTDLVALLESTVADYSDAGKAVIWTGGAARNTRTRPKALHRIVVNLIDNSLKFAGAAEVVLESHADAIEISVMDRGPGIPPEAIDKVIRPFYRVEGSRSRETGGTGLGLAIVQRLLVHCEAELTLRPREGGGLVAKVRLPV